MGCSQSAQIQVGDDNPPPTGKAISMQDEARLFRSNVGAIKMITRNPVSQESFAQYLAHIGKGEYLQCFQDLEEIKLLSEDQIVSRTAALIWRYKAMYESVKVSGVRPDDMKYLVWESLGKLRQIDIINIKKDQLMNYIMLTQNELLSRLVVPFEGFMASDFYKQWQESQLDAEKKRKTENSQQMASSSLKSQPKRPDTFSNAYPDVLIVDDSIITLKLTGLTLERDGHHVDKAANGQIALDLMKCRQYDVVLIDINMPVMDGFETVRLFRDFEKNNVPAYFPCDVSELSDAESEMGGKDPAVKIDTGSFKARQTNSPVASAAAAATKAVAADKSRGSVYTATTGQQTQGGVDGLPPPSSSGATRRSSMAADYYHQLIIGMSTNIDDDTRDKALACGMDYFLPKPFTLQKFIETIKRSKEEDITSNKGKGGGGVDGGGIPTIRET